MQIKTFAAAAALAVSLSGAAFAQTAAGGTSAEGNMNNPGSVKSNSEKAMGGAATGAGVGTTGSTAAPGMARDVPSNATPGAPAGSNGGNAATGSGAAPSGK